MLRLEHQQSTLALPSSLLLPLKKILAVVAADARARTQHPNESGSRRRREGIVLSTLLPSSSALQTLKGIFSTKCGTGARAIPGVAASNLLA